MKIVDNLDLTNYNSYRIRAACRRAIFFDTEDEIYNYFLTNKSRFILLGSGHNVILSKVYYNEDFIIFNGNFSRAQVQNQVIVAESGIFTSNLCELAHEAGLSGLEVFYDIPSSIGGAVVMNAGAGGEDIQGMLLKVRYLDLSDNKIKEIDKSLIEFEYRDSFFQRHTDKVILKVWIQLRKASKRVIREKMEAVKMARHAKQPRDLPNAGSVFKRPPGYYVGAMIDELQLKGMTVGGAKVSEKHGGFIVNYNNATGNDVITLIRIIQHKVYQHFGVILEIEQRII